MIRLLIVTLVLAWGALAADISGNWNLRVTSPQGEHAAKLTLALNGEKVSGAIQSERGEHKIEGTLKDERIEFFVEYSGGDAPSRIPFTGKVETADKMTGRYSAGEAGGDWTATRVK
jgi:hypothetical protein